MVLDRGGKDLEERMTPLLDEVQQLCNIVGKSIVTAKGNQQKPNQQSSYFHCEICIFQFSF